MSQRILLCCLMALMAGCARNARPDSEPTTPHYEHVFLKPLGEALDETRKLLSERGYSFEPTEDEAMLLTTWQTPTKGQWGNVSQYRYLVNGIRVSPRQSVVRVFRLWRTNISNSSEARPGQYSIQKRIEMDQQEFGPLPSDPVEQANKDGRGVMNGARDLVLEKELTLRLESGAGIEVVTKDVAPEPERPQLREADFYLDRWKQEGTAQAAEVHPCPQEVRELAPLLKPSRTLLIGEQLGSREAPAVVGDMVCQSAAAGFTVALGLSIPRTEQERINQYLASPGAPADQDELLRGLFWRRPYQDGRSSRAIMDLIDRVRSLRTYGLFISVVAYDTEEATGSERDALLAKLWEQRRKSHPSEVFVILAGNMHTRTVRGTPWDQNFIPMAKRLATSEPALLALDLSYAQGRRWGCDLNPDAKLVCTIVGASPSERVAAAPGQSPFIRMFTTPSDEGFHGLLYVGALTPSLPATSLDGHEPPPTSRPPAEPQRTPVNNVGLRPPEF
ncbi:MAG: hypothetical protein ACJ8AT_21085 [Hyalangium sp.]|uniref:hypothetical protein n=1 Tax=Hyalangium sp. TaxID=2028555 RepID=UPI00389AA9A1